MRGCTVIRLWLAMTMTAVTAGCGEPRQTTQEQETRPTMTNTRAVSGPVASSRVVGKSDRRMTDGSTACYVAFVYGTGDRQDIAWDEPCADVDAAMADPARLRQIGWWDRLEPEDRQAVERMPGSAVMYVSGSASASIFPIGTTGVYEVSVAD